MYAYISIDLHVDHKILLKVSLKILILGWIDSDSDNTALLLEYLSQCDGRTPNLDLSFLG